MWQADWQGQTHTFVCSDLMDSDLFDSTVRALAVRPTLLYSDPPWNQGNVNSFRTKAQLGKADHTIWELYARVLGVATTHKVPAFVEGGNREAARVQDLLPGTVRQQWGITYYRKHPCTLHYSGSRPLPPTLARRLAQTPDDDDTPVIVMEELPPGLVLDPCAGRGLTARTAAARGWSSCTNELSPWRMSVAMYRLAEITGVQARRIS